jgi:hypothetical protein
MQTDSGALREECALLDLRVERSESFSSQEVANNDQDRKTQQQSSSMARSFITGHLSSAA